MMEIIIMRPVLPVTSAIRSLLMLAKLKVSFQVKKYKFNIGSFLHRLF